jgi:hypothetical protein
VVVSGRWRARDLLAFYGLELPVVESLPAHKHIDSDLFSRKPKYLLTSSPSQLSGLRKDGRRVMTIDEIRGPAGNTLLWLARVLPSD